ncbi:hypothetical protein PQR32_42005 [Paraburkholderia dipogonis]
MAKAQSKPGLAAHALQWIARLYAIESRIKDHTPNIKVANRGAAGAELYHLYLAIGKMLDDPRRVLKARQRLHLGMEVSYIGGNPLAPPSHGTVVELRQTQAVIQDNQSRQRWSILYAAVIPGTASGPTYAPAPPPRAQREEFFIGNTVGFTDKYLSERVGIIVRLNAKTASLAVDDPEGHWRVSYALLRKIVDI